MKAILKYFWKYCIIVFIADTIWFFLTSTLRVFLLPDLMRHIFWIGSILIPFIFGYHTFWKQITELEDFIESKK